MKAGIVIHPGINRECVMAVALERSGARTEKAEPRSALDRKAISPYIASSTRAPIP